MRAMLKVKAIVAALILSALPLFNNSKVSARNIPSTQSKESKQDEKDRKLREKLEAELRRELDGQLSKVQVQQQTIPTFRLETQPIELQTRYDKFKDVTTVSLTTAILDRVSAPNSKPVGNFGDLIEQ